MAERSGPDPPDGSPGGRRRSDPRPDPELGAILEQLLAADAVEVLSRLVPSLSSAPAPAPTGLQQDPTSLVDPGLAGFQQQQVEPSLFGGQAGFPQESALQSGLLQLPASDLQQQSQQQQTSHFTNVPETSTFCFEGVNLAAIDVPSSTGHQVLSRGVWTPEPGPSTSFARSQCVPAPIPHVLDPSQFSSTFITPEPVTSSPGHIFHSVTTGFPQPSDDPPVGQYVNILSPLEQASAAQPHPSSVTTDIHSSLPVYTSSGISTMPDDFLTTVLEASSSFQPQVISESHRSTHPQAHGIELEAQRVSLVSRGLPRPQYVHQDPQHVRITPSPSHQTIDAQVTVRCDDFAGSSALLSGLAQIGERSTVNPADTLRDQGTNLGYQNPSSSGPNLPSSSQLHTPKQTLPPSGTYSHIKALRKTIVRYAMPDLPGSSHRPAQSFNVPSPPIKSPAAENQARSSSPKVFVFPPRRAQVPDTSDSYSPNVLSSSPLLSPASVVSPIPAHLAAKPSGEMSPTVPQQHISGRGTHCTIQTSPWTAQWQVGDTLRIGSQLSPAEQTPILRSQSDISRVSSEPVVSSLGGDSSGSHKSRRRSQPSPLPSTSRGRGQPSPGNQTSRFQCQPSPLPSTSRLSDEPSPQPVSRLSGGELSPAASMSWTSSEPSPVASTSVKEKLSQAIRRRHGSMSCEEQDDVFHEEGLTTQDIAKKERRREQNRRAAQKCRQKKKDAADTVVLEYRKLQSSNTSLKQEIRALSQERDQLSQLLDDHMTKCPLSEESRPTTAEPQATAVVIETESEEESDTTTDEGGDGHADA